LTGAWFQHRSSRLVLLRLPDLTMKSWAFPRLSIVCCLALWAYHYLTVHALLPRSHTGTTLFSTAPNEPILRVFPLRAVTAEDAGPDDTKNHTTTTTTTTTNRKGVSRRAFVAWSAATGTSWNAWNVAQPPALAAGRGGEIDDDPSVTELSVVPFSSNRQYKSIRLVNGMQVLLVSDKVVQQASAALTIGGAGQFSDPAGLNGLAHLMEHMTLSSRTSRRQNARNKYQDFEEWLNDVDGSSNGFTAYEKVCFHFNCPIEAFQEALERFARIFQQEVFAQVCKNEDTLRREIRRVNSELINSDGFLRELYMTKALINQDHPYANPSAGSLETLENIPNERGIDVGERLIQFFKEHYQPDRAVLVVVSPNEISALEAWVAPFSAAFSKERRQGDREARNFPEFFPRQNRLATICLFRKQTGNGPGEDLEKLSFQWGLNLDYDEMGQGKNTVTATQIGFILSQILGRRGPGSLFTLLKRRKWIPEGTQGLPRISFPVDVPGFQILRLEITLTQQGFSSRSSVIAAVYDSINSLQGNPLNPFLLGRELITEYASVAQLYGYVLAPRPPDAVELAFDAQLYGIEGPYGVGTPRWRLFPFPQDRNGIVSIQKALQQTLNLMSDPGSAIIISTASKKTIQFAEKNVLENSFPPLSPASWKISPVTGARYYSDNMFRLTGKVNEWLVARLMEDELSPPVTNPLIPSTIRPPRIPDMLKSGDGDSKTEFPLLLQRVLKREMKEEVNDVFADYPDDPAQTSILRDLWTVLRVSSHGTLSQTLQLPRAPPEPSGRCVFVLQLLSSRPARANTQMAARAELWKMSLEYAISDLVCLSRPIALSTREPISPPAKTFFYRPSLELQLDCLMKSVSINSECGCRSWV
jgi:insulysin